MKKKIIDEIIRAEGGYVNDPADSGGETNFGITCAAAKYYGYTGPMIDLPRELAFEIYASKYWDEVCADEISALSASVAAEVVDTGVNCGTGRAAEFLQRALNVFNNRGAFYPDIKVDKDIGPSTIGALKSYLARRDENTFVKALNCMQGAFYIELSERREKDERFVYGWLKERVDL